MTVENGNCALLFKIARVLFGFPPTNLGERSEREDSRRQRNNRPNLRTLCAKGSGEADWGIVRRTKTQLKTTIPPSFSDENDTRSYHKGGIYKVDIFWNKSTLKITRNFRFTSSFRAWRYAARGIPRIEQVRILILYSNESVQTAHSTSLYSTNNDEEKRSIREKYAGTSFFSTKLSVNCVAGAGQRVA